MADLGSEEPHRPRSTFDDELTALHEVVPLAVLDACDLAVAHHVGRGVAGHAVGEAQIDEHRADLPPFDASCEHAVYQIGDRVDLLLRVQLEDVRLLEVAAVYSLARSRAEVAYLSLSCRTMNRCSPSGIGW